MKIHSLINKYRWYILKTTPIFCPANNKTQINRVDNNYIYEETSFTNRTFWWQQAVSIHTGRSRTSFSSSSREDSVSKAWEKSLMPPSESSCEPQQTLENKTIDQLQLSWNKRSQNVIAKNDQPCRGTCWVHTPEAGKWNSAKQRPDPPSQRWQFPLNTNPAATAYQRRAPVDEVGE